MGIIDIIKEKIRPTIKHVPMKVCMMGPRAVGKTTVLTAVFNESRQAIAESKLVLKAVGDTEVLLSEQTDKLKAVFACEDLSLGEKDRPNAGIDASSYVSSFDFQFGLIGKEPRVDLQIKDFPGEFVRTKPDEVVSFIKESTAVMVAIDTPHLMEHNGNFSEIKNRIADVTNIFKMALQDLDSEKLIMFVPLKSEKYFNENRMPEVLSKVKSTYQDLISLFSANDKIACSVIPIKTMGDVQFEDFSYDQDGSVLLDVDQTPKNVLYQFYSKNGDVAQYKPRFCVQPLYSLLSFVAAQYKRGKKQTGFLNRLLQNYAELFDSDEPLFKEVLMMEKSRLINPELGFVTLTGSELFQFNK